MTVQSYAANDMCPLRVRGRIQPSHAEHQCTDEPKISVTASNAKPSPKSSPSPPTSSPNSPAKPSPPSPPPSARQGNTPQWCGRGSQPEVKKRFGTSRDRDEASTWIARPIRRGAAAGWGRRWQMDGAKSVPGSLCEPPAPTRSSMTTKDGALRPRVLSQRSGLIGSKKLVSAMPCRCPSGLSAPITTKVV